MIIKVIGNIIHNGQELEIGSEVEMCEKDGQSLIDSHVAELVSDVKPLEDDMPKPVEVESVEEEVKEVVEESKVEKPKRKRRTKKEIEEAETE